MNTFGASKYLEAEQNVVEGIMFDLKDQLTRLKIEELAIRAAIRKQMAVKQIETGQEVVDEDKEASVQQEPSLTASHREFQSQPMSAHLDSKYLQPSTSRDSEEPARRNEPIEVSINAALELISKYREQDFMAQSGENTLDTLDGEIDDNEIDDETEVDEPADSNEHVDFLDLRNCGFDEADFDA